MVLSSQVYSEPQVVADGLAIDLLESMDLTYQIVPDYDETDSVVAGWNGDEFQYFVAFSKLPPGWLEADVWITGFARDINAASERNSLKVLDRNSYKSSGGYELTYIEISFIPKGEQEYRKQLVHFITDRKNSYLAFATPTSESGEEKLRSEVIRILNTAHASVSNITPLIRRNEDRYIGLWVGSYVDKKQKTVEVTFELKSDLTFARKDSIADEKDGIYSGAWSISNNTLNWTYLYGKPTSQESKSVDTDSISSFTGNKMVLNVEGAKTELILQRAE